MRKISNTSFISIVIIIVLLGILVTIPIKGASPLLHSPSRIHFGTYEFQGTREATEEDISKTPPAQIAIRDRLLTMLDPKDKNSIFDIIDAIEKDPVTSRNCHEIAHDIGHKAYEIYGFSGSMNFTDTTRLDHASVQDICAGGYIHGILEEASLHQPDFTKNPGELCTYVSKINRSSCYHGVGHALMFAFERGTKDSITATSNCDRVAAWRAAVDGRTVVERRRWGSRRAVRAEIGRFW